MFSGSIPALVTPFRDGAFDAPAFKRLIDWQIDEGTSALVPCGTTGESPTLGFDEHYRVIDTCIEAAAGRVPVIAGCGSNDTATAVRHMLHAQKAGAAAALVVAPYYNRPTQAGLLAHFSALADACDLPIVVYNVPGRTVADISAETMNRLAELPSVVAIKDASGDLARVTMHRAGAGEDFCQLSGNDDLWLPHAVLGGAELYFGHRQCRAAPVRRFRRRLRGGRLDGGACPARPAVRPAQGDVLRRLARAEQNMRCRASMTGFRPKCAYLSSRRPTHRARPSMPHWSRQE